MAELKESTVPKRPILSLNKAQAAVCKRLSEWLKGASDSATISTSPNPTDYLLLGPGGSGKTTVIVHALNSINDVPMRIVFCAFTNKATQVLKKIAEKFDISFNAEFMTIHKLLGLELKYGASDRDISFKFDKDRAEEIRKYDLIVFDECSIIDKSLYKHILKARELVSASTGRIIKFIFLGDFWQLPPVNEEKSVVFAESKKKKWMVSKLSRVMRSATEIMSTINTGMLDMIPIIKNETADVIQRGYPYNYVPRKQMIPYDSLARKYIHTWRNVSSDTVILSYSIDHCRKTNIMVQNALNHAAGRESVAQGASLRFHTGDRCMLVRPIEVHEVIMRDPRPPIITLVTDKNILEEVEDQLVTAAIGGESPSISGNPYIQELLRRKLSPAPGSMTAEFLATNTGPPSANCDTAPLANSGPVLSVGSVSTGSHLYNGEIFDILEVEETTCMTPLNQLSYIDAEFPCQVLTVRRIDDAKGAKHSIVYIAREIIDEARDAVQKREHRFTFLKIMTEMSKLYPTLDYGYCLSVYKSQGSEWHTVFVNMTNIQWCILRGKSSTDHDTLERLYRTVYTALSRASHNVYITP